MRHNDMFGKAIWVAAGKYAKRQQEESDQGGIPFFPVLHRKFTLDEMPAKALIRVVGLGFFHCFINGKEITKDQFVPLLSDFEERPDYPSGEKVTGHRLYVPEYDIKEFIKEGENVLAIWFGGGYYCEKGWGFDDAKAIYRMMFENNDGKTFEAVSSENDIFTDSYVKLYNFSTFERQDYTDFDPECFGLDFDASACRHVIAARPVETEFEFTDCPKDRTEYTLSPMLLCEKDGVKHYDAGKNITGYPVLKIKAAKGETVKVLFAEEKNEDGTINMSYHHGQYFKVTSSGKEIVTEAKFTWFGFRYFSVEGDAEPIEVKVVRCAANVTSSFECDNETLNWLYEAYINTQLNNMHCGVPSDCPHIERRPYTGDGELTCHAVMDIFDARAFYEKWIKDIGDCQDVYSGHVQYTAPYYLCGGGPGAWGGAIVEVPYAFYKNYGDIGPFKKLFPQMLHYFEYLEAHCENGFVTSDKPGMWCLGDWLPPEDVQLPEPFVNTYFFIRTMMKARELAHICGRDCDIPLLDRRIAEHKKAMMSAYFNLYDHSFVGGIQGANAFALDIGLGDERTYQGLVRRYEKLGKYDTGICGTDILTRVLFEHGNDDLAVRLMASEKDFSFYEMKRAGATTLWENWPHGFWDRSRNHPMFGAVCAYLFDYVLGINQAKDKAGYEELTIEPGFTSPLTRASGSRTLPAGEIYVSWEKKDNEAHVTVYIPEGVKAVYRYKDYSENLNVGENQITVKLK